MENSFQSFISYCKKHIKGDEKGESQIFLDRFFTALGYEEGLKGAGAECEFRIRDEKKKSTSFADLVWKPRVLIEMKKKEEDLSLHYQQALEYWFKLVPNRPQFVILCNFDEFWIYDFNLKVADPVDIIKLEELSSRSEAISFLFPKPQKPVFNKDRQDVTEKAALQVSYAFNTMSVGHYKRVAQEDALRYCLQCVVAMFAEDVGLLPDKIFTRIIEECEKEKGTGPDKIPLSLDLIGGLFREMNTQGISGGVKYRGVDYFNGGLFEKIIPIELTKKEIEYFESASLQNWRNVNPAIFGSLFEGLMQSEERHKLGAHYTHESDIMKIVDPVIVRPWRKKIEDADSPFEGGKGDVLDRLYQLLTELRNFKVLDPACGSGNFLFVAYREMKNLEKQLLNRIRANSTKREDAKRLLKFLSNNHYVSTKQLFGIDIKPDAVELAKVTLMIAKELWYLQTKDKDFDKEKALPLDNLDKNIICADSLFTKWHEADAIIGNPPYQSKRNMQAEFGADYVNKLRTAYPEFPGRADFCVYWFYKAHQHLKENGYAGLVGTNTITQNYSREGSLEYILKNGGEIFNAYQSFKWSGEAAVTVSIVNWKKGKYKGEKHLYTQENPKSDLEIHTVDKINSSLTLGTDVVSAHILQCNTNPKKVFQGQVPGEDGFFVKISEAKRLIKQNKKNKEVLKLHLIADDLLGNINSQPSRFCIDFSGMDIMKAASYKEPFKIIEEKIKPLKKEAAEKQIEENNTILKRNLDAKVNKHHLGFYERWWHLAWERKDMLENFTSMKRYIACSGVSKRNIFEFVSTEIIPNAAVFAFCFEDDYSFGIIQSNVHWEWWKARCSTFETRLRYTANTVWDTFPFPQNPTQKQIEKVARSAKALRDARNQAMKNHTMSLRYLYRILEQPGKNPIKDLHAELDKAVMDAYGFVGTRHAVSLPDAQPNEHTNFILTKLLELNLTVAEKERKQEKVQAPGLPEWVKNKKDFVSGDCVRWEE